jgi:hypothetical protein
MPLGGGAKGPVAPEYVKRLKIVGLYQDEVILLGMALTR